MVMMLGWLRADAERASCRKRRNRSMSAENAAGRVLIATQRSRRTSLARYTSPMPPAPSGETISYGPSLVPDVRAISARHYVPKQSGAADATRFVAKQKAGYFLFARDSTGNPDLSLQRLSALSCFHRVQE